MTSPLLKAEYIAGKKKTVSVAGKKKNFFSKHRDNGTGLLIVS